MYCVNSDALVIFWTGSEDREKFFNELRPNQSIRVSRDLRSLFALTLPNYQMTALLPRIFDRWFALLTVR